MANLGPAVTNTSNTTPLLDLGSDQLNTQALATPYILVKTFLPMLRVSTGTMGANGALSGITAVARAYPQCYMYFPAGAVFAGSAAGWYYATMLTTTTATVYNNIYVSGVQSVPTALNAIVAAGPGAFTGDITSQGMTYTVPGGAMGLNGAVRVWAMYEYTNSAGTKTPSIRAGGITGTTYFNAGLTVAQSAMAQIIIANNNSASLQTGSSSTATSNYGLGTSAVANITSSVNTAVDWTIGLASIATAATDNFATTGLIIELLSDGT